MPLSFTLSHKAKLGFSAAALFLLGGGVGAAAVHASRPMIEMAPLTPVAIARAAQTSGPITLRGRVAEIYGSKFVLQDASGRTLIDLGPHGDGSSLVAAGAIETVQGRFDRGFVRASFLVDPSGNVTELGPVGEPSRHGPHDPRFAGGPDGPPPPPGDAAPAAATQANPAPPPAAATSQAGT